MMKSSVELKTLHIVLSHYIDIAIILLFPWYVWSQVVQQG